MKASWFFFVLVSRVVLAQVDPETGLTQEEKDQFLIRHNAFRRQTAKRHNAQNMMELQWDDNLAKIAYGWAQNCQFDHGLPQGVSGDYGQNLYMTTGSTNKYGSVDTWYYEFQYYNFQDGSCNEPGPCGHYTQVVWSSTRRLGCAHYKCPTLRMSGRSDIQNANYVVCQYDPPGNIQGQPILAVGRPCSRCPGGSGFCNDGLCTEKCPADATNCECLIECDNCGERDKETCSCKCGPGFSGNYCEEICTNNDKKCGVQYPAYLCTHPSYESYMKKICPLTCGICALPVENWHCDKTTYAERFSGNFSVGYNDCVFPFTYKGVSYDRCTKFESVYQKYWCGTSADSASWAYCVTVKTYGGPNPDQECNFPFVYQGRKYYKCIDNKDGYKWCGLTDNYDVDKKYGYCDMTSVPDQMKV